jgi:hypothetical protein
MAYGKGTYGTKVGRPSNKAKAMARKKMSPTAKKTGMKYKKTLSKMNGNKKGLGKVKPMKNIPKKK